MRPPNSAFASIASTTSRGRQRRSSAAAPPTSTPPKTGIASKRRRGRAVWSLRRALNGRPKATACSPLSRTSIAMTPRPANAPAQTARRIRNRSLSRNRASAASAGRTSSSPSSWGIAESATGEPLGEPADCCKRALTLGQPQFDAAVAVVGGGGGGRIERLGVGKSSGGQTVGRDALVHHIAHNGNRPLGRQLPVRGKLVVLDRAAVGMAVDAQHPFEV